MTQLKRIHVNQHVIKANKKTGAREPVITIKTSKSNTYSSDVTGHCPHCDRVAFKVRYRPDKPLSCGAVVWIETRGEIDA